MSKKATIVSMVINIVYAIISAMIACKFGWDVEFGVKTILMDIQYNVPWDVIIRQSFMPDFLMNLIVTLFGMLHLYLYVSNATENALTLIRRTKEQRDAERFAKWVKKEQKRLRKLERTC